MQDFLMLNYHRLYIKFKIALYHFAANLSGSPHLIRHLFVCFLPRNKLKKGTFFLHFCPEAINSKKQPFRCFSIRCDKMKKGGYFLHIYQKRVPFSTLYQTDEKRETNKK